MESMCSACRHRLALYKPTAKPMRAFSTSTLRSARFNIIRDAAKKSRSAKPSSYDNFTRILNQDGRSAMESLRAQPHRIHIFATKHNTHITLTRPAPPKEKVEMTDLYKPPEPNQPVLSFAAGNIGFRKSGRGTFDAAYQLASYVMKQIQERGLLREIRMVEVVLRGFGAGREAVTKALLGQEGRFIRPKITAITDATRLKFGGSRSPNPRRLG